MTERENLLNSLADKVAEVRAKAFRIRAPDGDAVYDLSHTVIELADVCRELIRLQREVRR